MTDHPNIEWLSPDTFVDWCQRNLPAGSTQPVRIMLTGAPGTGKTTAVELLARTLGLTGHIVPVGHVGGTHAEQQRAWQKALDDAEGGILVLEAPIDLGAESWPWAKEALTELADRGDRLAVVWMQYRDREWDRTPAGVGGEPDADRRAWVQSYLDRNFPTHLGFPNLTPSQIVDAATTMATDGDYVLTPDAADALRERLAELSSQPTESGASVLDHLPNYRFARRVVELASQRLARRISNLEKVTLTDFTELTRADLLAGVDEILHARNLLTKTG